MSRRPPLSHHVRSPAIALLADEIARQADDDLHAALASSYADLQAALTSSFDVSFRPSAMAPAPSARADSSPRSTSTSVSKRLGTQQTPRPSPRKLFATPRSANAASPRPERVQVRWNASYVVDQPRGVGAEPRHAVPLRKQYLGSPRTPRATAVSTEEVVEVSGGRLNVQRSVSHTACSYEEAGAELRASPALPALDDFSALRAELVRVS